MRKLFLVTKLYLVEGVDDEGDALDQSADPETVPWDVSVKEITMDEIPIGEYEELPVLGGTDIVRGSD